eukprot:7078157-Pyramimonas_sp.AAC.1
MAPGTAPRGSPDGEPERTFRAQPPTSIQDSPRDLHEGLKAAQEGSKTVPKGPRALQDRLGKPPKRPPRAPKKLPR